MPRKLVFTIRVFSLMAYLQARQMIQLEGYPFATVNPALSVEKAAERESWCILTAKEFFLKQTTSAPVSYTHLTLPTNREV